MKLYKYCGESGVYILGSGQLRLSPPNKFNDPFEFSVVIDYSSVTKSKLLWHMKQDWWFFDGWYSRHRMGKDLQLSREFYNSHLEEIADQLLLDFPKNIEAEQGNSCNRASDYWAVGCFSKIKDSTLMWSHYAENHRGMVFEFDTDYEPFNLTEIHFLRKVRYMQNRPVFKYELGNRTFNRQFPQMASCKHECWRYEKEWRIIFPRTSLIDGQYMPLNHQTFSSVILGHLCSERIAIAVHSLLRQPEFQHVKLYKASMNKSGYSLDFVEIPRGINSAP